MEQLIYVAMKFAAYVLWCGVGVALFRPQASSRLAAALKFGFVRLLLGVFLGVTVFLGAWMLKIGDSGLSHLAMYLVIYVPLRWVEWSIMGYLLQPGPRSFLVAPARAYAGAPIAVAQESGSRSVGVWWKLGGIAVSHLADLPLILALGGLRNMLPIGRFVC